jgi:transposase
MEREISERYKLLKPLFNEKLSRLYCATEAKVLKHGGIQIVSKQTGLSRTTISNGLKELEQFENIDINRIRKEGGGRKKEIEKEPAISFKLDSLIEPALRGEPESSLLWTSKSLRKLSNELKKQGYNISHKLVGKLLKEKGFSLQANRKTYEGKGHPDRDSQFEFIHYRVKEFQMNQLPVISVDAKKKELIGNYKNNGKEWTKKYSSQKVNAYDFLSESDGLAIPYGVYDLTNNDGWVSVGIDHDTAEFAVESIKKWWDKMGKEKYIKADKILITADGGGSNGRRNKLWKKKLQDLSDEINAEIHMCHFPPGTSKWNKIEHRLFSNISKNWRGKPLISYEVIVNLIASTSTTKGLRVQCEIDRNKYKTGIKISDNEMKNINISRDEFHGEWNYVIKPKSNPK